MVNFIMKNSFNNFLQTNLHLLIVCIIVSLPYGRAIEIVCSTKHLYANQFKQDSVILLARNMKMLTQENVHDLTANQIRRYLCTRTAVTIYDFYNALIRGAVRSLDKNGYSCI